MPKNAFELRAQALDLAVMYLNSRYSEKRANIIDKYPSAIGLNSKDDKQRRKELEDIEYPTEDQIFDLAGKFNRFIDGKAQINS